MSEHPTTQQKPFPVPVHEWPKDAVSAEYLDDGIYFLDKNNICIAIKSGVQLQDTVLRWTRAEALASQMLPAPDRVGVWAIYREAQVYSIENFEDLTVYPDGNSNEYVLGCSRRAYSVSDNSFRFYFMGPLPTAESEVQP